jgi:hypothetical protein
MGRDPFAPRVSINPARLEMLRRVRVGGRPSSLGAASSQIFVATAIATWVCSLSSEKIDIASLSVIFPVLPQSDEWKLIARNLVSSHYVIA